MPDYRRAFTPGGTYFFTVVTYRRRPILCDAPVRAAVRETLRSVQAAHPFDLDAWVLLPDHLHCIWVLPDGDAAFPKRWAMVKRGGDPELRIVIACGVLGYSIEAAPPRIDAVAAAILGASNPRRRRSESAPRLSALESGQARVRLTDQRLAILDVSPLREAGILRSRLGRGARTRGGFGVRRVAEDGA